MIDAHRYTVSVRKAMIDGEVVFEARVRELPDVATYGDTHETAYNDAIAIIEDLARVAEEKKKPFPAPAEEEQDVTGRVTLRLPKWLHARAVQEAETQETSLNTFLVSVIANAVGTSAGEGWLRTSTAGTFQFYGVVNPNYAITPGGHMTFYQFLNTAEDNWTRCKAPLTKDVYTIQHFLRGTTAQREETLGPLLPSLKIKATARKTNG
jgi:predicted HicB family RNase H-like nuclease